jgi:hypothetical protein
MIPPGIPANLCTLLPSEGIKGGEDSLNQKGKIYFFVTLLMARLAQPHNIKRLIVVLMVSK